MGDYRVALDVYHGPLDLLLFLIQREEIDIYDIPISRIMQEYMQYVEVLERLDPEIIGEFLILAATLMEIKSRLLLPSPPPEELDEEMIDPRLELVHQLLEYKKYKEAARSLESCASEQALKHMRSPVLPPRDPDEVEMDNLELWDLFDAFNRILEQTGKSEVAHQVTIDDTPIALHADDVIDTLQRAGGAYSFSSIFTGRSRAEMIGLFLALLELIRQKRISVKQATHSSEIQIHLFDPTPLDEVDDLDVEYNLYAAQYNADSQQGSAATQNPSQQVNDDSSSTDRVKQEEVSTKPLVEKSVDRSYIELNQESKDVEPASSAQDRPTQVRHSAIHDTPSGD